MDLYCVCPACLQNAFRMRFLLFVGSFVAVLIAMNNSNVGMRSDVCGTKYYLIYFTSEFNILILI